MKTIFNSLLSIFLALNVDYNIFRSLRYSLPITSLIALHITSKFPSGNQQQLKTENNNTDSLIYNNTQCYTKTIFNNNIKQ